MWCQSPTLLKNLQIRNSYPTSLKINSDCRIFILRYYPATGSAVRHRHREVTSPRDGFSIHERGKRWQEFLSYYTMFTVSARCEFYTGFGRRATYFSTDSNHTPYAFSPDSCANFPRFGRPSNGALNSSLRQYFRSPLKRIACFIHSIICRYVMQTAM